MAALRVSSALASSSSSSFPCYPSTFTKFQSSPSWAFSITVKPLCSRRSKRIAHCIARDTLGLTKPNESDVPKIWKGDILAIGATEKDSTRDQNSKFMNPLLQKLDSELNGLLSEASSEEDFSGKSGQSVILRLPGGLGSTRIALVGLGSSTSSAPAVYHSLGEAAAAAAKSAQASNIAVALASTDDLSVEAKLSSASAIATGVLLGIFEDNRFRSESKKPTLESLDILGLGTGPEIEKKIKYAEDVCAGIILGRELVNAPANVLTPAVLAEEAKKIASTYSDVISVNILDAEQCKELKMGAYLAVAFKWKGDILAIGATEKDSARDQNSKFMNPLLQQLDSALNGLLSEASSEEDFSGKSGQSVILRLPGGLGSTRIALVGLGSSTASAPAAYHSLGEAAAAAAKSAQASNIAVALASTDELSVESKLSSASAIATGVLLGIFEDNRFRYESKKPTLESLDILGLGTGPEIEKKIKYAEDVCAGIILGRELVNAPANVLTPAVLAEEAKKIASTYSDVISVNILDAEQCKELKMGAYLAVAAAATENPPYFIHLCFKTPTKELKKKIALVGKGLTFDSGGYNIKAGAGSLIELMKYDMAGAAAVLGAAKALGELKPTGVEVHIIVTACENMISGEGMRPGDIVTASNGKTIEVNNTDAEGRLTLADTLIYACNQGVEKIIDLATLTGAVKVALGPSVAGAFTPSDDLAKEVLAAAEVSGEKLWRMPMEESYWDGMKSGVADMINTGPRDGGAITAALFLKQFVDEKVQWLHIYIASTAWSNEKKNGTGYGVSTLVKWVLMNT